jgi:hypothetical protein
MKYLTALKAGKQNENEILIVAHFGGVPARTDGLDYSPRPGHEVIS